MSPQPQYDLSIPIQDNLFNNIKLHRTSASREWLRMHLGRTPWMATRVTLWIAILGSLIFTIVHGGKTEVKNVSFWVLLIAFLINISVLCIEYRQKVYIAPKLWREKAQGAIQHIDEGGIILVLSAGDGAAALPFAQEVVRRGAVKDVTFVCIDRFSPWRIWPGGEKRLFRNLTSAGIPPQSLIAHKAYSGSKKDPMHRPLRYNKLPFTSGTISLVISDGVLIEKPFSRKFEMQCFEEIVRVLQPGGRAIVADDLAFWGDAQKSIVADSRWKACKLERFGGMRWHDVTKSDKLVAPVGATSAFEMNVGITGHGMV